VLLIYAIHGVAPSGSFAVLFCSRQNSQLRPSAPNTLDNTTLLFDFNQQYTGTVPVLLIRAIHDEPFEQLRCPVLLQAKQSTPIIDITFFSPYQAIL